MKSNKPKLLHFVSRMVQLDKVQNEKGEIIEIVIKNLRNTANSLTDSEFVMSSKTRKFLCKVQFFISRLHLYQK